MPEAVKPLGEWFSWMHLRPPGTTSRGIIIVGAGLALPNPSLLRVPFPICRRGSSPKTPCPPKGGEREGEGDFRSNDLARNAPSLRAQRNNLISSMALRGVRTQRRLEQGLVSSLLWIKRRWDVGMAHKIAVDVSHQTGPFSAGMLLSVNLSSVSNAENEHCLLGDVVSNAIISNS